MTVGHVVTAGFALLLWLCIGVLCPLRMRLGERVADWLLPNGQSATFRMGMAIAKLARAIGPRDRVRYKSVGIPEALLDSPYFRSGSLDWSSPEAAVAELEADLREERRVIDPVRLTAPLLVEALRFTWLNTVERTRGVFLVVRRRTVLLLILLAAAIAVGCFSLLPRIAFWRRYETHASGPRAI